MASQPLSLVILGERFDNLRRQSDRFEADVKELRQEIHHIDLRLSITNATLARIEGDLKDLKSRRWDVNKIVLAILLSSIIGLLAGLLGDSIRRTIGASPSPSTGK